MEKELQEESIKMQEISSNTDHDAKFLSEQTEGSNTGVRKSSRPRKQSKRVLDSADCHDDDTLDMPFKKKHRRDFKFKTSRKKDVLPNGRPFRCSLCESPYINNSPTKAKMKREHQPIVKEKNGQLLHLCVKCAIAVNHTENKGPTPEQRAEFEEEGRQFAQLLVKSLNDSAAARLYCSFYQTTKCGCIQSYILGTPANRRRKMSMSGSECGASDAAESRPEEMAASLDDKADQTQRVKYLLGLLKESVAKKQAPCAKKSKDLEKGKQSQEDSANMMKESEKFILENRIKLKELGICERGCQKVLCYSNNFLHKKTFGSQPRLQRTKGRAALGRLHPLQDLHKLRCCDRNCVKLSERDQAKVAFWRQQAQQSQKEMWKVLEEMLTTSNNMKPNCYKFISLVTGCCLTTVQKVYADVLLSKGTAGCASKREHGMRFHWKRQKELGKPNKAGLAVVTPADQPQLMQSHVLGEAAATADTPAPASVLLFTNQAVTSDSGSVVMKELKTLQAEMIHQTMISQAEPQLQPLEEVAEGNENTKDIKKTFLQLCNDIKDPQEIAHVHEMLALLQRDLKMKKERQGFPSQVSLQSSGSAETTVSSLSYSATSSLTNPAAIETTTAQTQSSFASVYSRSLSQTPQEQNLASVQSAKTSSPFVHISVAQTIPAEHRSSVSQISHQSNMEHRGATSLAGSLNLSHLVLGSDKEDAMQAQTGASQVLNQPVFLSSLSSQPGVSPARPKAASQVSRSLIIGNSPVTSLVGSPHTAVTSSSLSSLPQQVGVFQVVPQPASESTQQSSPQVHQILSVCPQSAPLHIQSVPLSSDISPQQLQFQFVSPLILGQSDLVIPFNQSGTMSFILPKQTAGSSLSNDTFSHVQPSSSNSSTDLKVCQAPAVQKTIQSSEATPRASVNASAVPPSSVYSFIHQTGYSPALTSDVSSMEYKYGNTSSSVNLGEVEPSQAVRNQSFETAQQFSDASFRFQATEASKSQDSLACTNTPSITVLNYQGTQNSGQEVEGNHQGSSIDQYFPSLLSQAPGSVAVGTPSSCSSGSFVFDALADSPVKDSSLLLSSPLLQPVPAVTSSLLCEMLMRSIAPPVSTMTPPSAHHSTSSVTLSPLLPTSVTSASTTACGSQAPVHSQTVNSIKSSLVSSAQKSASEVSGDSQSLNFRIHATPSTASHQPVTATVKVEQPSLPLTVTTGHSIPLAHSQISAGRLHRQKDPPQVGIVLPHVSGVKGGSSQRVGASPNNTRNHSLSASSSSLAHMNVAGETYMPPVGLFAPDGMNQQVATSGLEFPGDNSANNPHHQQQLLLSLLMNSQQNANPPSHPPSSVPQQASHINLTTLFGSSGCSVTNAAFSEDNSTQTAPDASSQGKAVAVNCNIGLQSAPASVFQSTMENTGNFIQSNAVLSSGNQNIVFGNAGGQLQASGHHVFQTCPDTGHVKLIPVILSDGNSSPSVSNFFPQNGQLFLSMNPCAGLGGVSSLSPQTQSRDSGIFLNVSPGSGQNIALQHPLLQVIGNSHNSSALPMLSPSMQSIHQPVRVGPLLKDQVRTLQVSVAPVRNQVGNFQAVAQNETRRDGALNSTTAGNEAENSTNFAALLPSCTVSSSLGLVMGTVHSHEQHSGQSFSHSLFPTTDLAQSAHEKANSNFESEGNSGEVFVSGSNQQTKIHHISSEALQRAKEATDTSSLHLSEFCQLNEIKTPSFSQTEVSGSQSLRADPSSQTAVKSLATFHNQNLNLEHASIQSLLQHQVPVQIVTVMQAQQEQANLDRDLQSELETDALSAQTAVTNAGLDQQLLSHLNFPYSNHVILPVKPTPFSSSSSSSPSSSQAASNTVQQLSSPHQVSLPTPATSKSNDAAPQVPLVQVTKSVSTPTTCTTLQSAIASSRSQNTSLATSCITTSKHRPIRPKLPPVPSPAQAPRISLMLVPDKPGYPAYQLAQLDQSVLSVQSVSEQPGQKEGTLPQIQPPQSSLSVPGTPQERKSQNPAIDTTAAQQLHPAQQPSIQPQILLVPTHQADSEAQKTVVAHNFHGPQNEALLVSSKIIGTNVQTVSDGDSKLCQVTGQLSDVPGALPQQNMTTQPGSSHNEASETTTVLQSLRINPAPARAVQVTPFQNEEYLTGSLQNGSVYVRPVPNKAVPSDSSNQLGSRQNSELSSLQDSALQFGSVEVTVSQCNDLSSLPSDLSQAAPLLNALPGGTHRFTPHLASLVQGGDVQTSHKNHFLSADRQDHVIFASSSQFQSFPASLSEFGSNQSPQTVNHQDGKLNPTSGTLTDSLSTSHLQSQLLAEGIILQGGQSMGSNKATLTMTQPSAHVGSSTPHPTVKDRTKAIDGQSSGTSMPSSSVCFVPSVTLGDANQLIQQLTQTPVLMAGMKFTAVHEDKKPTIEPVHYLQCKEVIDLTDDSPPLSPSKNSQLKGKILSSVQKLNEHPRPCIFIENLQREDSSHSQIKVSQPQLGQPKREVAESCLTVIEAVAVNLNEGANHLAFNPDNKKDFGSDLMMLEQIPEEIRQVLIASLEAHAAGNPDVHLETRTFTPSDEITCRGFLTSSASSQQTEDQFNAITRAISKNKCPSAVVTISTNQRFQDSVRAKPQPPYVALVSAVSGSSLDGAVLTQENDSRQPVTSQGSNSNNNQSPRLSSLCAVGTQPKQQQLMNSSLVPQIPSTSLSLTETTPIPTLASQKLPTDIPSSLPVLTSVAAAVPRSPAIRASAGRSNTHTLTSSTVAFIRTTNTPTDAVGPPNVTIMSPAQVNSSSHLRFRHEGSFVPVTAALSQPLTNQPTAAKTQNSGLLKLTSSTASTSVPTRAQSVQPSSLLLCSDSGVKASGQATVRLSLENAALTDHKKEASVAQTSSSSVGTRSVDSLIKFIETPQPPKPKPRKRPSTIMDLLKNKEKQQATAAAGSSPCTPVVSTPGPVTLMFSGTPRASNLLVMGSSAEHSRVDPNTMNITVKNLHLLGKGTSSLDKSSLSSQISSSVPSSGFTVLQPNILQVPGCKSSDAVLAPVHATAVALLDYSPSPSFVSIPTTSQMPCQSSDPRTTLSLSYKATIHTAQSITGGTANGGSFIGSLSQPKVVQDHKSALFQPITLSNQISPGQVSQAVMTSISNREHPTSNDPAALISLGITQGSEAKQKHHQDILKSDTESQLLLIGQPQVVSGLMEKPPASDVLVQKSQPAPAETFNGEKLKFKTSLTKSMSSEDRPREILPHKLQFAGDSQRGQLLESGGSLLSANQGMRTSKKLLLMNDKTSESESLNIQVSSSSRSGLQLDASHGQVSAERTRLPLKSPQLLQLMKSKQPFSHLSSNQPAHLQGSQSPMREKPQQPTLQLGGNNVSAPVSGECETGIPEPCNMQQASSHQPKESLQKNQLSAIAQPAVLVSESNEDKSGTTDADGRASDQRRDTRRNLLPSQNPLLANILFTNSSLSPFQSSSFSAGKSLACSGSEAKNFLGNRISGEANPFEDERAVVQGHQVVLVPSEDPLFGIRSERHLSLDFETEKAASIAYSLLHYAPPTYSQPPFYERKNRVNKVIEDVYKFPDEGDEASPPPFLGSLKSQLVSQKQTSAHPGQKRSLEMSNQTSDGSSNKTLQHLPHSAKSNMKMDQNTEHLASGHSGVAQASNSFSSVQDSGHYPQVWKSPKKVKSKKSHEKSNSRLNLKKVQFSDVVTSQSASEYGQPVTVDSSVDAAPSEMSPQELQETVKRNHQESSEIQHSRNHQESSEIQYSSDTSQYLSGKHRGLAENRQDGKSICERHPYVVEQLQTEARESRLRTYLTGNIETELMLSGPIQASVRDVSSKISGLAHSQREKDGVVTSGFECGRQHEGESHRGHLSHLLCQKQTQRTPDIGLLAYEKQKGEKDTGSVQCIMHSEGSPYTLKSGFVQENLDTIFSSVSDKHMYSTQSGLRCSSQTMGLEAFGDINSQCDDMTHIKTESSNKDVMKRKQFFIYDESSLVSSVSDHRSHTFDRKHYSVDKKELPPSSTDSSERDSAFDQPSSFNILSTQGYSKLSRQRLNRVHNDHLLPEDSSLSFPKFTQFSARSLSTNDASCSSDQSEEARDFPQQMRNESACDGSSDENVERRPSESPLIRHKILESSFELARQMKKRPVRILKDSRSEALEGRNAESPQKLLGVYPDRRTESIHGSLIHRDMECQTNKELDHRALPGAGSRLTSPVFSETLDGRADIETVSMLSSLESLSCLRKEIKDLTDKNFFLKREVARAEQYKEFKEQQRQRQLSSSDKQRSIITEAEKAEKLYNASPSHSNQPYVTDSDSIVPPRKRHPSSTAAISSSPLAGSEQLRHEEGYQIKPGHPFLTCSGIQQMLESDVSFQDNGSRGVTGPFYSRNIISSSDDHSPTENYNRDARDFLVLPSMGNQSRPTSQLDQGTSLYEPLRHRYPSSEMKPASSRVIPDGDGFVPLLEHTRHRNLSSSLGQRALPDVDPPPYDISQRQRNPSASSLKSAFQEGELLSFDSGARSRNPSSSSWVRYWEYGTDSSFSVIRSRNPSGSSNRRSRPGSSSSDRELPVNMDELPLFSDIAHTRSRNSSGESIEPTMEFLLDPQQFMQYTYHTAEALIKRTKH